MKTSFEREKLSVSQEAIRFEAWVGDLLETQIFLAMITGLT